MIERPLTRCNMMPTPPSSQPPMVDTMPLLAEEVRAYLVSTRGGAPFLSAADGRLLVSWLDEGVPVAAVLAAIERVARRRVGRRLRTRMTLSSCKSEVKKLVGTPSTPNFERSTGATAAPSASLAAEIQRLEAVEVPAALVHVRAKLVAELRGLDLDAGAPAVLACVRRFHERVWDATAPEHAALQAAARSELSSLEGVVSAKVFADLIDEHVRQGIRARVAEFTMERVWTALGSGDSP